MRVDIPEEGQVVGWIRILRGRRPLDSSIVKSALLCSLEHIQELRREIAELKSQRSDAPRKAEGSEGE